MVHTLADIAGDGTTHQLTTDDSIKACWVQFQVTGASGVTARVGDSLVTTSRGAKILDGGFQFMPTAGNANSYNLSNLYYNVGSGDTLTVTYDTF